MQVWTAGLGLRALVSLRLPRVQPAVSCSALRKCSKRVEEMRSCSTPGTANRSRNLDLEIAREVAKVSAMMTRSNLGATPNLLWGDAQPPLKRSCGPSGRWLRPTEGSCRSSGEGPESHRQSRRSTARVLGRVTHSERQHLFRSAPILSARSLFYALNPAPEHPKTSLGWHPAGLK